MQKKTIFRRKSRCLGRFLHITYQHSWTPKVQSKSDFCFCSHANNPPLQGFSALVEKNEKANSIKDVDPHMREARETGLKLRFHNRWVKFSGSILNKWDTLFYSHWVLYNFASCKTDFHWILCVVSVPFSALLLLQAYSPSQTLHPCKVLHDP